MHLSKKERTFIRSCRVAHLATADRNGRPLVIPVCYAFDGKSLFSPIDEKPKQSSPLRLKRIRNILENSNVAVVIDRYDEDWRQLGYVLIRGKAKILLRGEKHKKAVRFLRRRYPQYHRMMIDRRPIIQIVATHIKKWGSL
jgi:PPOX class probable F420-dependent enzyme